MAFLNDPTRGNVTLQPSFFEQQRQKEQQQQLARLQLQNIQSQIGLRGAQAEKAGRPTTETGSSLFAKLKEEAGRLLLDPNTSPEVRKRIQDSGIFGGARLTQIQGGGLQKSVEEDAKIAQAFQDKADELNTANPDANTEVVVETGTKGQRFLATKPKAPPSAGERIDIADALASEDALNNLGTLFDKAFVGPVTGRVGQVKELFGGNPQQQSEFLAATAAFKNAIIKQITGAQMSEPEAKRIVKQIPLPEDPPISWKSKRKQSLKNIAFMKKRRLQVLRESGLRVPKIDKKEGAFTIGEIRTDIQGNNRKYIGNGQWQLVK